MERRIIHIDMDAFFASVEQRDNPSLRGKPLAVGGSRLRGVVAAASYEARVFGVRSAMPSVTAKRLCPSLIFVKPRFEEYRKVSMQIRTIFEEYSDLVEPLSLDEAYLDVSANKAQLPSAKAIAEEIRKKIFEQTQLTASAGVSFNKFLAKIASDMNKPNGVKVITPQKAIPFLENLPIEKFHGIGKVTASKMKNMGIFKGSDLKALNEIEMFQRFGKAGRHYYKMVRALDDRPVRANRIRKSIGAERTFKDNLESFEEMWLHLKPIAQQLFDHIQTKKRYGRTVNIKMKTPDFQIFTRSKSFNSYITEKSKFISIVEELLLQYWEVAGSVRLLGVSMSNLSNEQGGKGVQLKFEY